MMREMQGGAELKGRVKVKVTLELELELIWGSLQEKAWGRREQRMLSMQEVQKALVGKVEEGQEARECN
jgi:hypothetical protein